MGEFLNVGAYVNGVRPATKTALKKALASDPSSVTFDATSDWNGRGRTVSGNALTAGTTFVVVGPCPFTKRNWYANVKLKSGPGSPAICT